MAGGNRSAAAKKAWVTRRAGGGVIGRANTMLRNRKLGGLALHSMKTKGGLAKIKMRGSFGSGGRITWRDKNGNVM